MSRNTPRSCLVAVFTLAVISRIVFAQAESPMGECAPEGKDRRCGHAAAQIARFQREQASSSLRLESAGDTDFTHCHLDIEIDPVAETVAGSNTIDVTARSDGLTQLTLDLQSNMTVDAVTINGATAAYSRPGNQIVISLDRAYNSGQTFQVVVSYHGEPLNLDSSFEFGTHGSPAKSIVASLSEPWGANTWWPCKEDLADKFTADLWYTVPDWMTVASNGLLEGTDTLSGNRKRYRWHESHPIDVYLVSVATTNYTKLTDTYVYAGGSMPVEFYIYPERVSAIQPLLVNIVPAIAAFSQPDVFGQYPFVDEKYGIAQFNWSGGMEHQTITSQGSFDEWISVHELSHQWWGDLVTCKTWHDIWLNEGFADYSEAIWAERRPGGSMAAYLTHMQSRRPWDYGGTVYCYDISSVDNIFSTNNSYYKGGWVVHMLRHVLGDAVFFDTLAAYRSAFAGGTADTEDFRGIAESVSGRDLEWFFDEWVYTGGAPYYRYGWNQEQIGSQRWVRLHVEQYQTSYPKFAMPIDVTISTAGGGDTRAIWNQAVNRQWYLLPAGASVTGVQFDKDAWILRGSASNVAYVNGPPKVIRTVPEPGTVLDALAETNTVQIQFSEPITYSASDFTVTGGKTGAQSFAASYSSSDYTVTLTFPQPLAGGQTWTVGVADTLRSQAASAALDGEMTSPDNPSSLPSGDGLPGGGTIFTFSVAVMSDFNHDGHVDADDLATFAACITGPELPGPPITACTPAQFDAADSDDDGDVDMADFGMFQRCYSGPLAPVNPNCAD